MSQEISTKQHNAIVALLEQPTVERAAESAGVSPKTLYRWMEEPGFRGALSTAEEEVLDETTRRLMQLSSQAIGALENVMNNPSQEGASNKRLAALAMLDVLVKFRELRSVEQRLLQLEEVLLVRFQ